jgi:hypothetical protein
MHLLNVLGTDNEESGVVAHSAALEGVFRAKA